MRAIGAVIAALMIGAGSLEADVASAAPVEIPGSAASFGIWRLAAYSNDRREFSHCAISATYTNGVTMTIAVSDNGTWHLAWAHPEWRLLANEPVELAAYVDGAGPYSISARANAAQSVLAELSTGSSLLEALRRGTRLTLVTRSARHDLNLDGGHKAFAEIVECARRRAGGQPNLDAPSFPAASARTGGPQIPADRADQRVEATIILSNLLARRDLPAFRILSEREIRELNTPELLYWHTVWRVDDLVGALRILAPGIGGSASELATTVIAQESRNCRGQLSSAIVSDSTSPYSVHLLAACEADASGYEARYVVIPRTRGGYYLSGMMARGKAGERSLSGARIEAFLRALSAELGQ